MIRNLKNIVLSLDLIFGNTLKQGKLENKRVFNFIEFNRCEKNYHFYSSRKLLLKGVGSDRLLSAAK